MELYFVKLLETPQTSNIPCFSQHSAASCGLEQSLFVLQPSHPQQASTRCRFIFVPPINPEVQHRRSAISVVRPVRLAGEVKAPERQGRSPQGGRSPTEGERPAAAEKSFPSRRPPGRCAADQGDTRRCGRTDGGIRFPALSGDRRDPVGGCRSLRRRSRRHRVRRGLDRRRPVEPFRRGAA